MAVMHQAKPVTVMLGVTLPQGRGSSSVSQMKAAATTIEWVGKMDATGEIRPEIGALKMRTTMTAASRDSLCRSTSAVRPPSAALDDPNSASILRGAGGEGDSQPEASRTYGDEGCRGLERISPRPRLLGHLEDGARCLLWRMKEQ